MPLFANFLLSIFGSVLAFFTWLQIQALGWFVVVVAGMVGAFAVCKSAIRLAVSGLAVAMPEPIVIAASWIVPDNYSNCLSTYASSWTAVFVYRWSSNILAQSKIIAGRF